MVAITGARYFTDALSVLGFVGDNREQTTALRGHPAKTCGLFPIVAVRIFAGVILQGISLAD